jgi:hypothetical protein
MSKQNGPLHRIFDSDPASRKQSDIRNAPLNAGFSLPDRSRRSEEVRLNPEELALRKLR